MKIRETCAACPGGLGQGAQSKHPWLEKSVSISATRGCFLNNLPGHAASRPSGALSRRVEPVETLSKGRCCAQHLLGAEAEKSVT